MQQPKIVYQLKTYTGSFAKPGTLSPEQEKVDVYGSGETHNKEKTVELNTTHLTRIDDTIEKAQCKVTTEKYFFYCSIIIQMLNLVQVAYVYGMHVSYFTEAIVLLKVKISSSK